MSNVTERHNHMKININAPIPNAQARALSLGNVLTSITFYLDKDKSIFITNKNTFKWLLLALCRYRLVHIYRSVKSVRFGISCVDCWAASAGQAGERGGGPGRSGRTGRAETRSRARSRTRPVGH